MPIDSLTIADLPRKILQTLEQCIHAPHFTAVAPNTATVLVSRETIADLPPGYVVVLVFDPVDPALLPPTHQDGKIYLVS